MSMFEKRIREGVDLRMEIRDSPCATKEAFFEYRQDVLVPTVESNRQRPGCQAKPAILFCDNCNSHCCDEVLQEVARHGILIITYPPHSSQIFQVLDVLLFGRLKSAKKHLVRDLSISPQLDHVMRVFRASEQATTSMMIRSSWEKGWLWVPFGRRNALLMDR
jgi:hypothetical protein